MVSMPTSEFEILEMRCHERNVFRNQFEMAYAQLNRLTGEVKYFKERADKLERELAEQRRNTEAVRQTTEEISEEFRRLKSKEEIEREIIPCSFSKTVLPESSQ